MERQKKLNIILTVILSVFSFGATFSQYFSWHENLIEIVGWVAVIIVSIIAAAEVFCYEEWYDHNPFLFWVIATAIGGTFFVAAFYLGGAKVIPDELTEGLLQGFAFYVPPILGSALGWLVRRTADAIRISSRWHRLWTSNRI